MNQQQLEYFLEAARTLNFTKTAEKFYISQSAVTQQMKNLEKELNVQLFSREKQRLSLTEAGRVLEQEAAGLLLHVNDVVEKVQSVQQGYTGYLNIGYLQSFSLFEFPLSIQRFHAKYPGVHLNLTGGHAAALYKDYQEGKYDILFNIESDAFTYDEDSEDICLEKFTFLVCMPPTHPLATRKIILQNDLRREPLIMCNMNPGSGKNETPFFLHALDQSLTGNIVSIQHSPQAAILLVSAGIGLAIVPAFDADRSNSNLTYVPLQTDLKASIHLYYRKNRTNPVIERFAAECFRVDTD